MNEKVKCASCGYLAVRETVHWTLCEAEKEFRDELELPSYPTGHGASKTAKESRAYTRKPICFARESDFPIEPGSGKVAKPLAEMRDSATGEAERALTRLGDFKERCLAQLHEDRTCGSFVEWIHGLTPKEHLEMNLLLEQRKWQREQAREDQAWRAEQAKQDRQWRQEDVKGTEEARERADERHRHNFWMSLLAVAVGAVVTLAAVILTNHLNGE